MMTAYFLTLLRLVYEFAKVGLFDIGGGLATSEGEIVLDPFCGSGTSVLAAETYGRKCRAMELSPHNCDVILARWEEMTGHAAVLLEGGAADARAETTD